MKTKQNASPVAALIRSIKSESVSQSNKSHMSGSESHQVSILNQHHKPNVMMPGLIVSAATFETQGNEENDLRAGSKDGLKYHSSVNSSLPSDSGENSSTHQILLKEQLNHKIQENQNVLNQKAAEYLEDNHATDHSLNHISEKPGQEESFFSISIAQRTQEQSKSIKHVKTYSQSIGDFLKVQ